ncbi:MAG: LytTR family DNA-binding domain-containing protein [Rhodocyclaceae bacterium]
MLNLVVAEDDPMQVQALITMIKSVRPSWRIVATAKTGNEALDLVERYQPDFVLLDIGLAGPRSGLDVADEIGRQCPIIFITGELRYAVQAFDLGATDYIVKPLSLERLNKAADRIEHILRNGVFSSAGEPHEGGERDLGVARYMQLASGQKLIWTAVSEVHYIQAEGGYSRVFLGDTSGLVRQGLLNVYQRLDQQRFWQIHRGIIINADFIDELQRDEMGRLSVRIKGYTRALPVSKNHERHFRGNFVL